MREGCPDSNAIAAYIDGQLDQEDRALVLSHITDCEECRREVVLLDMARRSPSLELPVPADLKARAIAANRTSRRTRALVRRPHPPIAAFLAAAGIIGVCIGLLIVASRYTPEGHHQPDTLVDRETPPSIQTTPDVAITPPPLQTPPPTPPESPEPPQEPTSPETLPVPIQPDPEPTPPAPKQDISPPTRARETLPARFASVKLTDLSGDLAIKRKGKEKQERIQGPVEVGEGDLLVADRGAAFFLLANYPISVQPQTQMHIAFEEASSAPALLIDRGEALIDSSATASRWYIGTKEVSVWIEPTRAKFAAGIEGKALGVTALDGHVAGKDDYGRPFDLQKGERLLTRGSSASTSADPEADRRATTLASTCPTTRTLLHVDFASALTVLEGGIDKSSACLLAAEKKGLLHAAFKLPHDVRFGRDYVVRARVRTNLQESRLYLVLEEKAQLIYTHKIRRDQRGQWINVEFHLDDPDVVDFIAMNDVGTIIKAHDRFTAFGGTGRRQDVFGDERPYLVIDDVQIALRAP